MDREELGQIVRRAWVRWAKKQESPKESWLTGWEELEEHYKEANRQIGESVQKAILQEYKGRLISVEDEGIRILGSSAQIPQLLEFIESHRPEFSYEKPHIINLFSVVKNIISTYRNNETRALAKLKSFKEDVLIYLRAIALLAETVGNAGTHKEKDSRLRGLIAQIETAIQKVRDERERFTDSYYWSKPDLFRSEYPVQRYLEKIRELEVEIKKLKGESTNEDAGF